jgi:hypothetical protein
MLRRQGLPPSCPHPEKWLVPVELPVSLLPGAQGGWDSQTLGSCVLCRGNVAVEGIKDGKHFPLLGISLQLRHHHSCGSPGPVQRAVSKGRAPGEPSSRTGRGHHSSPPAGKGIRAPRRRRRIVFYTAGGGNSATRRILAVSSSSWKCGLRKITHLYAPGFPGSSLTSTRASRSG